MTDDWWAEQEMFGAVVDETGVPVTTTDTDALTERIERAIYARQEYSAFHGDFENAPEWLRESMRIDATAVLPIIAVEVRKAKADAWDEGWKERARRDIYRSGPLDDPRPVPGPPRSLNPYREAGDSDEHR